MILLNRPMGRWFWVDPEARDIRVAGSYLVSDVSESGAIH